MDIDRVSDEELVRRARSGVRAEACLEELYARYYDRVAFWCLRVCGDRERATELAQEVFLRVHERLDSFRLESRFSTWLYTVARNVSINRGVAERRRQMESLDAESVPEPWDTEPDALERLEKDEVLRRFRRALDRDLEPLEARVLYLHYVHGLSLAAVTDLLELSNKSGAKAYIVNGRRKLARQFGRWLEHYQRPAQARSDR